MQSANKLFFFLILFIAAITPNADASHASSGYINYECVGNDSFLVTLNLYRDCEGIDAPTSATISTSSVVCGVGSAVHTLQLVPSAVREVSQVCSAALPQTSCNGGLLPGIEQYVYSGIIVLPTQCPDWILSYSLCCRNSIITTLNSPGSYDLHIQTKLDNRTSLCNNSPVANNSIYYLCAGQPVFLNFGATETDGDSLVYSLVCPLDGPSVCATYSTGFSPTQPIATTGPFGFNTHTGFASFTPSNPQAGVVAILVDEYRNGVLIGNTLYEIQLVVVACNNAFPRVGNIQNPSGGFLTDSITITTCPGQPVSFQFPVTDANPGDSLYLHYNPFSFPAGATLTSTGTGNNITGRFSWTPSGADVGTHVVRITAADYVCPIYGFTSAFFTIRVLSGVTAGVDTLQYCAGGVAVQLNALGGNIFNWTPASGLSSTTIANPTASPAVTTSYIVTSNLTSCQNTDTITVEVVPGFNLQLSGDSMVCVNGAAQLHATATPGGTYSYAWQPFSSLLNAATANPLARPTATTTYTADVTAANGCVKRDSFQLSVNGVAPIVTVTSDTNNVCPGDTVQLFGTFYPGTCGASSTGCSVQNPPVAVTIGGTTTTQMGTPFAGSNEDERFQALYYASDLTAAGVVAGTISRIEFEVAVKASTGIYSNFTIKMGCTSATELTATTWAPDATTIVYGPSAFATTLGVNTFPLSVPYDWDGRSNLLIEICFDNMTFASASGNDQLLNFSVPYSGSIRTVSNNTNGCTLNSPNFAYTYVPKITIHSCPPAPGSHTFAWSPSVGLINSNTQQPKVVLNNATQYTFTVSDTICTAAEVINLVTDNSYSIQTIDDTTVCGTGAIQLNTTITGAAPPMALTCGVHGTPCGSPSNGIEIGTGSNFTGSGTPYEGTWEDARIQLLYRASELQSAGLTESGVINSIAFFITNKRTTIPFDSFTIRIACTSLNSLVAASGFVQGNFTEVYGPLSYSSVAGWNKHTFSSPYNWDGTSNLLVEICFNNPNGASVALDDPVAYTSTLGTNTVLFDFTDFSSGCSITTPSATTNRANTRFTYCVPPPAAPTYNWSPSTSLSSATVANPIATATGTTTYHLTATFADGCRRTDSVTIVSNPTSLNTSLSNDTTICAGTSVQLVASGGITYQWLNPTGLSCSTCSNTVASPAATTTYKVLIADTVGCSVLDSVKVTVHGPVITMLANDTILCSQTSVVLNAGVGFASYAWSTGSSTQSVAVSTAGNYTVTVTDQNGCQASATARVDKDVDCVWPGDANNDGIANNMDVLAIGVGYGSTGSTRPNATLTWQAQSAPNWVDTLAHGVNYKHVDCNGNGNILDDDTLAISMNYGQTHPKGMEYKAGNPPLFFVMLKDTFAEGENVVITVSLGHDTMEVNNFYGIAFTLNYDNTLADENSIEYEAEQSFAGIPTTTALGYDKGFFANSKHVVALTRIDQTTVNGYGQIGTFSFNVKDTLNWSTGETIKNLNLTFSEVMAIDAQENEIPLSPLSKSVTVKRPPTGIADKTPAATLAVYPNPANQNIIVTSNALMREVTVHDMLGKALLHFTNVAAKNFKLDAGSLANGNYLLKVKTERGEVSKKVVIVRE